MTNAVLNKRHILDRLRGFTSRSDKLTFLKWQKDNLSKSSMPLEDRTKYENRLIWLNEQINIINHSVDDDTSSSTLF